MNIQHRILRYMLLLGIFTFSPVRGGIMITTPADYQVVKRTPGTTRGEVPISGVISGEKINRIQAAVFRHATGESVVPWSEVNVITRDDGSFTGILTVPQGGWYRLAVRIPGKMQKTDSLDARWGVGINVLCIGQSNMVGNGDIHEYTPVTAPLASLYGNDRHWRICADPYDTGSAPGDIDYDPWLGASMIPAFVNSLCATLPGVPVGIIPAARGASPLHGTAKTCWVYRDKSRPDNPDNLYGNSVAKVRAAGGAEIIIMHQGETDATENVTSQQYASDLKQLLANYREDIHPRIPLFICQLARSFTPVNQKNRTDSTMQRIRVAQLASDDPPDVYLAAVCIDVPVRPRDDHYFRDGYDIIGVRMANAVAFHWGKSSYYRGPSVKTAVRADSTGRVVDVAIMHRGGSDFTPDERITGFAVLDAGKSVPVVTAVRMDVSTVRLTLERRVGDGAVVTYLAGKAPDAAGAVRDNSSLRLPLEPTGVPVVVSAGLK